MVYGSAVVRGGSVPGYALCAVATSLPVTSSSTVDVACWFDRYDEYYNLSKVVARRKDSSLFTEKSRIRIW